MGESERIAPDRIMQFAWGYGPAIAIEAAVRHRIFDILDEGSLTLDQLASRTGASVRGLKALANLLVALGLLARQGKAYLLTPESATFLVSNKPGYHGMFFHHLSDQIIPRWLQLHEVVRTGTPATKANDQSEGEEFFAQFVESLFPISFAAASHLGEHLGVPRLDRGFSVLDIGAGSGVWSVALAKQSAHVRIHAVDWPKVLEVTRRVAAKHGVADRHTTSEGDFFSADFGRDHQLATIGHILHGEGPERSRKLLKKTFKALAPGGIVAISEFVPNDDRTGPVPPLIFAVNMLVNTDSGDTFTFAEMSAWLLEAGFVNPRLLEAPAVSPLVLADKPR
jgi:2-polyprenyl-3-methyl-5-hydroxy-6-metoxy-1,4-benzoquinol methylase